MRFFLSVLQLPSPVDQRAPPSQRPFNPLLSSLFYPAFWSLPCASSVPPFYVFCFSITAAATQGRFCKGLSPGQCSLPGCGSFAVEPPFLIAGPPHLPQLAFLPPWVGFPHPFSFSHRQRPLFPASSFYCFTPDFFRNISALCGDPALLPFYPEPPYLPGPSPPVYFHLFSVLFMIAFFLLAVVFHPPFLTAGGLDTLL